MRLPTTRRTLLASGLAAAALPSRLWAGAHAGVPGLDLTALDRGACPGDDFYRYVNGAWLDRTEIPADQPTWTEFSRVRALVATQLHDMLTTARDAPKTPDERKLGNVYASLMDEAAIETLGLAPLRAELDRIDAVRDVSGLAAAMASQATSHPRDWWESVAPSALMPISPLIYVDFFDPSRILPMLVQGGLGMPDRSYYLSDKPEMVRIREAYRTYVATLLTLAGRDPERSVAVVALETRLAQGQRSRAELFNFKARNTRLSASELPARLPGFDWQTYLDAVGYAGQAEILVADPEAFAAVTGAVRETPLADWREYLAAHALMSFAPVGPKAFAEAHFAFNEAALKGATTPRPRERRMLGFVDLAMAPAVGAIYIDRYLPAGARAAVGQMAANIRLAMGKRIERLSWMSPSTKAAALNKLKVARIEVGGPLKRRDFSGLRVARATAWSNMVAAARYDHAHNLAKLGRPADRGEWEMLPHRPDAQSSPFYVKVMFSAALMQAPVWDVNADPAVNYGALGFYISHEFSHLFDNQGSQFDATGRLRDWWTPEDAAKFKAVTAALALQYGGYEVVPGLHANGAQTLPESIADLGGVTLALDAYHLSLGGRPAPVIDGLSGDQRFFMAYAQLWRGKTREAFARRQTAVDTHPLPEHRVATVRNLDAWYTAFDVKPGDRLYLTPEQRVRIW